MDPQKVSNSERIKVTFSYLRSDTSRPKRLVKIHKFYLQLEQDYQKFYQLEKMICHKIYISDLCGLHDLSEYNSLNFQENDLPTTIVLPQDSYL